MKKIIARLIILLKDSLLIIMPAKRITVAVIKTLELK